jgi:hypothetical protein
LCWLTLIGLRLYRMGHPKNANADLGRAAPIARALDS